MATRKLAASVARQAQPATRTRTAFVTDVLPPSTDEEDVTTGWQVLLDFGGGQVRRAGIAASYRPVPGDTVMVSQDQGKLFVVDRVTAGDTGDPPGTRVAYGYVQTPGTYVTAAAGVTDVAIPDLSVTAPMRNGAAYKVRLRTGYSGNTANTFAFFRLRQDSASGLDIGEFFRGPISLASTVFGFDQTVKIRNDTGVDLDVAIVTTISASPSGTASGFCTAQSRAFIEVDVLGPSTMYPYAAAVQAPVDIS